MSGQFPFATYKSRPPIEIVKATTFVARGDRTESGALRAAIDSFRAYVSAETLATELTTTELDGDAHRANVEVDGCALVIALRRASPTKA